MRDLINKEIIIQRSSDYGNNFPYLVKIWKNFLKIRYNIDVPLEPADVAFMFALHKVSRLVNNPQDEDTLNDLINYSWLGTSYSDYVKMLNDFENDRLQRKLTDNLIKRSAVVQQQPKQLSEEDDRFIPHVDHLQFCKERCGICVFDILNYSGHEKCPKGYILSTLDKYSCEHFVKLKDLME